MNRFTIRQYSEFGTQPQEQSRILFESDSLTDVKMYIKSYFMHEKYYNAVYFVDNKLNKQGYVGRNLTIACGENLSDFCEIQNTKLKKIKDLTVEEQESFCNKYLENDCECCPLYVGNNEDNMPICIKGAMNREVEVDEKRINTIRSVKKGKNGYGLS